MGSNLEMAWMNKVNLIGADLRDANLQEAKMNITRLNDADMTGARIHYGNFQMAQMEGCTGCPFDWE